MTKISSEKNQPVCPALKAMKVGDCIKFPISRINVVRSSCSTFGLQWGIKFKTHLRSSEGIIEVFRIN